MSLLLGLDTGGTYTDAVLVDDAFTVQRCAKSLTTHRDLIDGLRDAVGQVVSSSDTQQIKLVSLSTTLATNALVEGRGRRVGLVLIGFSEAQLARAKLSQALAGDPMVLLAGGHNAGGDALCELDVKGVREFVLQNRHSVDAFAVSALFAVRNPQHELDAQELIQSLTGKPVTCGHHLSSGLDAPRRALTALLNARLIPMISQLLDAAGKLLDEYSISAPLMVVKGDGSLISEALARSHPVETILSGPAASLVGARHMCHSDRLLVSDMGGTTTDIAVLENGQPRLSTQGATVGGWRTMVKAIDVHTYGLGGDSAVVYDRDLRQLAIGPNRVVPLCLVVQQYPDLQNVLDAQLALPMSTTHSAQFVITHADSAGKLSYQQQALYDQLKKGPLALQTLFNEQTQARALQRLEQRGLVIRAGFTPTDASHIVGQQSQGSRAAAISGAKLLMRYSEDNLGTSYVSELQFAKAVCQRVSELSSLVLIDALSSTCGRSMSESQKVLLEKSFGQDAQSDFSLRPHLHLPVVGLGAPAAAYYQQSAKLLDTTLLSPDYAHVANALGAVVGSIRQEQVVFINPAGGKRVLVMLPEGPLEFDTLDAGAQVAILHASRLAREKALRAGANDVTLSVDRDDTVVKQGDDDVFFESRITVTASGRPAI